MPGLGGRMSTVIKAKVSKLLDRAEDPGETLDYGYQKQVELLQNVKKGIADVVTSKKRLQMQSTKLEQQVVKLDTQARQALSQGREELARAALERKTRRPDRAAVARHAGRGAREAAGAADREREEAAHQDRDLPHQEGGHQGPVLRRRGAGQDLRGGQRGRRGDGRPRPRDPARRGQDRADARPRAAPSRSSRQAGAFDDITQLGAGQDDIDRELAQLGAGAQVDDELAKMKAELGSGGGEDAPAARAGREGGRMIVRISGEGQFELPDEDAERLNELDNDAVAAVEAGDEAEVRRALDPDARRWWPVDGTAVGEDELVESDVILPPRDITFAEARASSPARA